MRDKIVTRKQINVAVWRKNLLLLNREEQCFRCVCYSLRKADDEEVALLISYLCCDVRVFDFFFVFPMWIREYFGMAFVYTPPSFLFDVRSRVLYKEFLKDAVVVEN